MQIDLIKSERTQIHFLVKFSLRSSSSLLKVPIILHKETHWCWASEIWELTDWIDSYTTSRYFYIFLLIYWPLCFQEEIATLLGGTEKVDAHHVTSCVSYCKEKYTLWRADIRKKVLRTNICERYDIIIYNYHDQHHHYLLNSHRFSLQTFVKFWRCMGFLFPSSYFLSPRAPKMTGSRVHVFLSLSSKVYLGIPLASSWHFWFLSLLHSIFLWPGAVMSAHDNGFIVFLSVVVYTYMYVYFWNFSMH